MTRLLVFHCALQLALLAGAFAPEASAADFTTASGCRDNHSDESCTTIYINGEIEVEDGAKWKDFLETITTPHAIVILNSPGGSGAGFVIAYDILNREYDTYFNEGKCASMCAIIWLAGKTRYMSSGATLGFHQAREDRPGNKTKKSRWGNDLAFAYYAKLKLSEKAMRYLFSAAPNELALVTVDKAIELGLSPEVWPKPKKRDVQPEKEPVRAPTKADPESACDAYAASDDDPHHNSAGISFDKIDAGLAVPACEAAVQQYPKSSRLNFQLGRAYEKASNFDAAVTQYRKAADEGFAPAQASLGAAYERGQGGVPRDYDEATKWYHLAAKQGDGLGRAGLDRLVGVSANGRALSQAIHEIDEIKGKIVDARTVQQTFAGLKYCSELNGTSFFSPLHDRIFNVQEYFHSLENLVKVQHYDAAKHRALTLEDAKERLEKAKLKAQEDRHKCELVQSLPKLEKRLQELQATAEKKE